jgi:ribosome-binding ATPase
LLDVAGLVPDAHLGKGMGNKFLSDLSRADALIHVIDISGSLDAEGQDLDEGARDPLEDIKFLEEEINFWFRDIIIREDWSKFVRKIEQEKLSFDEMLYERMAGISVKKSHIQVAMQKSKLNFDSIINWTDSDILTFATTLRRISKPIVIAANKIDKSNGDEIFQKTVLKVEDKIIPCSGLAEYWLRKFEQKKVIDYIPGDGDFSIKESGKVSEKEISALNDIKTKILKKYGNTGIQEILNYTVFQLLNLIPVYPVYDVTNLSDKDGNVLPDAHLILQSTKLKDFVNDKIHSDLAKNFIYGINVRSKMRLGEAYELQKNDVVKIVSAAKKK